MHLSRGNRMVVSRGSGRNTCRFRDSVNKKTFKSSTQLSVAFILSAISAVSRREDDFFHSNLKFWVSV